MITRLAITPEMEDALALIARASQIYQIGAESASVLELPKLALADATLAAIGAAERRQMRRLWKLPKTAKPMLRPVVELELRPKRRRA